MPDYNIEGSNRSSRCARGGYIPAGRARPARRRSLGHGVGDEQRRWPSRMACLKPLARSVDLPSRAASRTDAASGGFAVPTLLARAGMKMDDTVCGELNEAFASQVLYCRDRLGIPQTS